MDGFTPSGPQAREIVRKIASTGTIVLTRHGRMRLRERNMTTQDVLNVLLGGYVVEVEPEVAGTYRVTVATSRMTVVVVPRGEAELVLVTAWRNER